MTSRGKFSTEEGSGGRALCDPPHQPSRWTTGLVVPAQCFTVRLDVHQSPQGGVWCYAFEVADPHSNELLAKVVEPARDRSTSLPLASVVSVDLRGVLLELTDPDPF